jgi:uncharacterized protein YutE (UPF0331/DUF86 family)
LEHYISRLWNSQQEKKEIKEIVPKQKNTKTKKKKKKSYISAMEKVLELRKWGILTKEDSKKYKELAKIRNRFMHKLQSVINEELTDSILLTCGNIIQEEYEHLLKKGF